MSITRHYSDFVLRGCSILCVCGACGVRREDKVEGRCRGLSEPHRTRHQSAHYHHYHNVCHVITQCFCQFFFSILRRGLNMFVRMHMCKFTEECGMESHHMRQKSYVGVAPPARN